MPRKQTKKTIKKSIDAESKGELVILTGLSG